MRESEGWGFGDKYRQPMLHTQTRARFLTGALLVTFLLLAAGMGSAQQASGPLVVYNAGSLARPFRELLDGFRRANPKVVPAQENSGSLEAARKLTELDKIPDVLAVADYKVLEQVIVPKYATWYAAFARNAMVLAYTDRSRGASAIDSTNWWRTVLTPGVRTGHSDPALDPNGYRTLLVLQLAERHYRQPGLARKLDSAMPPRFQRPKEADLTALLQAGELDYAWSYRSLAQTAGLRYVTLPAAIDLSDAAREPEYAVARVRVPAAGGKGKDLEFRGEPIVYALTIPTKASHPATAAAFLRFVFAPEGRRIFERNGFVVLAEPRVVGTPPPDIFMAYTLP